MPIPINKREVCTKCNWVSPDINRSDVLHMYETCPQCHAPTRLEENTLWHTVRGIVSSISQSDKT